jgi:hypothetical protein
MLPLETKQSGGKLLLQSDLRGGGSVSRESITQPEKGQVAGTCGYGEGLSGSINAGNFLTSCKVNWLASQEGLCSMK